MSGGTKDNFEKGIFWELYLDLERQFQNFLEYVPYLPENETVHSFKLLNLILAIGGHVDSAFKEMARYRGFANNVECQKILEKLKKSERNVQAGKAPFTVPITLPLKGFEKEDKLSMRKVMFKRSPEEKDITPFKPYNHETRAPEWWEIYNGLKHDVSINLRKANLQTTVQALAGAFLLNAIHIPSVLRLFNSGVLKIEFEPEATGGIYFREIATPEWVQQEYEEKRKLPTYLETPLFIYDYEGWEEYYE